MKRTDEGCAAGALGTTDAAPAPGSLRALYADALQQVMADPQRAIAEHDPWLAALLAGPGAANADA